MSLDAKESQESLRQEVLQRILKEAGAVILRSSRTQGITEKSGAHDFTTEGDLNSEAVIKQILQEEFPDDMLLSEETKSSLANPLQADSLWIADPIDGTHNFRYGRNYSAVSLAYAQNGEVLMGGAYNPYMDELFFAEKGKGAFLNGKPIQVGNKVDLSNACVVSDNSYNPQETKRILELFLTIQPTPWFRATGCAVLSLAEIASGRSDLFFHISLKPWDTAAMKLLVEEAGGKVVSINGTPATFMTPGIIAGNPHLVKECVRRFQNHPQD